MLENAFGFIATALMVGCSIPQLIKTWKTKSVDDISLISQLMCATGCLLFFIYVICTNPAIFLMINYGINFLIYSAVSIFCLKYRKK